MILPDYKDFLNSLSEERLKEIFGDGDNLEDEMPIVDYCNMQIANTCMFSVRLLRAYHEWLSKQFEKTQQD